MLTINICNVIAVKLFNNTVRIDNSVCHNKVAVAVVVLFNYARFSLHF